MGPNYCGFEGLRVSDRGPYLPQFGGRPELQFDLLKTGPPWTHLLACQKWGVDPQDPNHRGHLGRRARAVRMVGQRCGHGDGHRDGGEAGASGQEQANKVLHCVGMGHRDGGGTKYRTPRGAPCEFSLPHIRPTKRQKWLSVATEVYGPS